MSVTHGFSFYQYVFLYLSYNVYTNFDYYVQCTSCPKFVLSNLTFIYPINYFLIKFI